VQIVKVFFFFSSFSLFYSKKKKECATGTYKADIGDESCTPCADHSETTSDGSTSCLCSMGYFRDSGSCEGIFFSNCHSSP